VSRPPDRDSSGREKPREEVEVKIPFDDLDELRRRLQAAGANIEHARHFESNDLYDDPAKKLSSAGRTLRLRRADGRAILTFKGTARFQGGVKTREERETEVSDPREAEAILAGVGFERRFRYEKRREEWTFEGCAVALDETPIGTFVEIEGPPPAIRRAVSALELDFTAALPYSYARLYLERRQQDPSLPPDMVFPPGEGTADERVAGEDAAGESSDRREE
jgi:adenylate cyclase class 2